MYVFLFFKQKTAYDMRISDWSSDVCSSDLVTRKFLPSSSTKKLFPFSRDFFSSDLAGASKFAADAFVRAVVALARHWASLEIGRITALFRSEERCVGKECVSPFRYRWSPDHKKKKKKERKRT